MLVTACILDSKKDDGSDAPGTRRLFVITSDYTSGALLSYSLDSLKRGPDSLQVNQDSRVLSLRKAIYVLERFGANNLLKYDPATSFAQVGIVNYTPQAIVSKKVLTPKTLKEFIAYARANPGKLNYASSNATGIVGGATVSRLAGIRLAHVPYKSAPQAIQDLLRGEISMMFVDFPTGLPHVMSGAVRALAATTATRSARANALNDASILWWFDRPYITFTCTLPRAPMAKPSKKSCTSSVCRSPTLSTATFSFTTACGRPLRSTAATASVSSIGITK